jgi:hypothetical protein
MMVPDYSMIAEIFLYSFGFEDAKPLSKKVTTVFKLSSEQLSSQYHYDFGMRAVKTVIVAAGNLKRAFGDTMGEDQIVLRAIRDVNVPKFLQQDLVLFDGIVSDLFPATKVKEIDYSSFKTSITKGCEALQLQPVPEFVRKVIELYETTEVRHGLMLVGPTCSGKTRCREVLSSALTALGVAGEIDTASEPPARSLLWGVVACCRWLPPISLARSPADFLVAGFLAAWLLRIPVVRSPAGWFEPLLSAPQLAGSLVEFPLGSARCPLLKAGLACMQFGLSSC